LSSKIDIPTLFVEQMRGELGDAEVAQLVGALAGEEQPTSIRHNPHKGYTSLGADSTPVEWCQWGEYLAQRPRFTTDPHFQAGGYYVQEAASMFVGHLLSEAYGGELPEGVRVLDMCAAPGGKSTLYATMVGNKGVVVANEVIRPRALTLADNIMKWGLGNTIVTNNDPAHFAGSLEGWFDVVAVDAPCSGEGMFRKSDEARTEWSPDNVKLCAARQRRIMADAWKALRPGGVFIYSTCTFNRTENEDNMAWLCSEMGAERVEIAPLPDHWGVVRTVAEEAECFHFYPHRTKGEGLFAAIVRKGGESTRGKSPKARKSPFAEVDKSGLRTIEGVLREPKQTKVVAIGESIYAYPAAHWADMRTVCEQMSVLYSGVRVGELFGRKFKPDHALALSTALRTEAFNVVELTLDDALNYLRRQELGNIGALAEGINLLTYERQPIGFTKRIGTRTNSLMPKELRILQ